MWPAILLMVFFSVIIVMGLPLTLTATSSPSGLMGVAAGGLKGTNKNTIRHGLRAVTREEMEAVIHIGLGGAVVKGGNVFALKGAHWIDGLASNGLDSHSQGIGDIGD